MKSAIAFLLLSAAHLLLSGVDAAAVSLQDCGETFQSELQQLLSTKRTCNSAAFYDCCQVKNIVSAAATGEYVLRKYTGQPQEPFGSTVAYSTFKARCDMDTAGGGWLVIQRRVPNGRVNFTRSWADYENGFGDLNGGFWYGLKNIHHLTTRDEVELRIDMVKKSDGSSITWTYQTFSVAGAGDKYRLTIGGGSGEGIDNDAMIYHNGQRFSTYDHHIGHNCAYEHQGGWWYNYCYRANLNGPHITPSFPGVEQSQAKIIWHNGRSFSPELSSVEMKIRVKNCLLESLECYIEQWTFVWPIN